MENLSKKCVCCGVEKPLHEFGIRKASQDGLNYYCKGCVREKYLRNFDKISQNRKKNYVLNAKKKREYQKNWAVLNRDQRIRKKAERAALKKQATPSWTDPKVFKEFKECADAFRLFTGVEYHVDHIIPLKHKDVCGLHCEANLKIIPWRENLEKKNNFTVS
jgi:5-methylcytosine-specific restriction endonuclease McrA